MTVRVDRATDDGGQETWRATLRLRPPPGALHIDEVRGLLNEAEAQTTAELHRLAGAKGAEFYEPPMVSLRATTGGVLVTATARVAPKE